MADSKADALSEKENKIDVSRKYSVSIPRIEQAYFIPVTEWARLKRMISKIAPPWNWFQGGAWLCTGIAITALLGIFGKSDLSLQANAFSWLIVGCFGVAALALFTLDIRQRQEITYSAKSVTDEMLELEKTYAPPSEDNAAQE